MGWAAYATQRLRLQHGPISHPQKIPSKYWVLKIHGRNRISKERNYPTHMNRSLVRSHHSDQAMTHPLRKRGTARFSKGSMGFTDPPEQAVLVRRLAIRSLAAPHPRCKPQLAGARESPNSVSVPDDTSLVNVRQRASRFLYLDRYPDPGFP